MTLSPTLLLPWALLLVQVPMLLVVVTRLWPGRNRRPPVAPHLVPRDDTTVSVLVATLNEAERVGPCLAGLGKQTAPLLEVLVVDSNSTDGTRALVERAAVNDSRIRLLTDPPLPQGWVGKVWALETGLQHARGEWILGIDADTIPALGMVGAVVDAAERDGFDVVSFAPQFVGQTAAERFVQPSMLLTLVYRCGAPGVAQPPPLRVLANGQCFLVRRALLATHGGYGVARASFADDVTLARHLASRGARVGFLDGSRIIQVRAYTSLGQMWREWGRSFDLKDATSRARRWFDVGLVWAVQALPLPLLLAISAQSLVGARSAAVLPLAIVNGAALVLRLFMLWALRGSYAVRGASYWLSWLSDMAAAWRLTRSMGQAPLAWRGRSYARLSDADAV